MELQTKIMGHPVIQGRDGCVVGVSSEEAAAAVGLLNIIKGERIRISDDPIQIELLVHAGKPENQDLAFEVWMEWYETDNLPWKGDFIKHEEKRPETVTPKKKKRRKYPEESKNEQSNVRPDISGEEPRPEDMEE